MAADFSKLLARIGRVPMLTPDEEIILGNASRRYEEMRETRIAWLKAEGIEPSDEQVALLHNERLEDLPRIKRRALKAQRRMQEANLRLVVAVAKTYTRKARRGGLTADDLFSVGSVGLKRAVEKFDPKRGYKFSTYAYWWVKQALGKEVLTPNQGVAAFGLGAANAARAMKVRAIEERRRQETGASPTVAEIADEIGWPPDRVSDLLALYERSLAVSGDSLAPDLNGEKSSLLELAPASQERPGEALEREERSRQIAAVLSDLPTNQLAIAVGHFAEGKSLVTLGRELQVPRAQLEQEKSEVLAYLQKSLEGFYAAA